MVDWGSMPGGVSHSGITPEEAKETHPGFTIICDKCGSTRVTVDNTMGWSPDSGGWGSVDLVCQDCGNRIEIADGYR